MGQELGWRVHSPIDISFTPIDQIEVDASVNPEAAGSAVNRTELWRREKSHLAVAKTPWLHLYPFKTERGWEDMFLPNGRGTVEWRLGWAIDIPRGYFLLILPPLSPIGGLDIPCGILSSTVTSRASRDSGISIAVRPTAPVEIRRGDEIARLVLLHADSLQVHGSYVDPAEACLTERSDA
ncbi:hypothetical protein ACW9HC_33765 [Nocardia gipuzkoensis]